MEHCPNYCGVACIDGSCPVALRDDYSERGYDAILDCADCPYNLGCVDCMFDGTDGCEYGLDRRNEAWNRRSDNETDRR